MSKPTTRPPQQPAPAAVATRPQGPGALTVEDTGLATRSTSTGELAVAQQQHEVQSEIQAAVVLAKRFPRDMDRVYAGVVRACQSPKLAAKASYKFPRGKQDVSGPSVYLARELGRMLGNIRTGFVITRDTESERTIEAFAWDLETNYYQTASVTFAKLQQRKVWVNGQAQTQWVVPDERDLRELTNKQAAIAQRNCLLQVMPKWLVDEAEELCANTRSAEVKSDPDKARRDVIAAFASLRVDPSGPEGLSAFLGCTVEKASPAQIVELREIYVSIRDGNSTWPEYLEKVAGRAKVDLDDLKPVEGGFAAGKAPGSASRAVLSLDQITELRALATAKGVSFDALEESYGGPLGDLMGEPGESASDLEGRVVQRINEMSAGPKQGRIE